MRAAGELIWSPSNIDQIADPYPAYERLRREAPLWRHPLAWVASRHSDVELLMRDRRLLNHGLDGQSLMDKVMVDVTPPLGEATRAHQRPWVLMQSGEHHALMRRLLNRGFSPRSLERARPLANAIVDELIIRMRDEPRFDFVEEFALPLPITMICELFGVPEEFRPSLRNLLSPLGKTMTGVPMTDSDMEAVDSAVIAFEEAMQVLIAERRRRPGDDMISLLVDESDGPVDEREVVSNLGVLLFAGHETTIGLFANGILALLRNPEQRTMLEQDPSLTDNAVEEVLRFDAPAQRIARIVHTSFELQGITLERGDLVWLLLGSANRDEEVYADADVFDIRRHPRQPLAFGKGPHFCIGAPLARLEAQVAFPKLLRELAGYELLERPLTYNPSATLRAPSELWLGR